MATANKNLSNYDKKQSQMRKIFGLGLLFLNGTITSPMACFQVPKQLYSIVVQLRKTSCAGMFPEVLN